MPDENEITAMAVAFLAGEGMSQVEIGKSLNLSQSAVSRILSEEKKSGRFLQVREPYFFRKDKVDDAVMDAIFRRASRKNLPKYLSEYARRNGHKCVPYVRVFPTRQEQGVDRFMEFTRQVAPYVASLLMRDPVRSCGVTWGFMLSDLCIALRQLNRPPGWKGENIRFTPLSGDPLVNRKDESPALTSSNIAAELGRIVNGGQYQAPWLGLVPAYIPEDFSPAEMAVIDRMVYMVPEYEAIFGKEKDKTEDCTAGRLDMLLTSVGTAKRPLGFGNGRLLGSLGPKLEVLKAEIRGDIGGVLLPRETGKPSPLVHMIEERWKGIRRGHLLACARRAAGADPLSGRPGVVLLSLGKDRAEAVAAAVAEGLVNHLLIDQELEMALERYLAGRIGLKP